MIEMPSQSCTINNKYGYHKTNTAWWMIKKTPMRRRKFDVLDLQSENMEDVGRFIEQNICRLDFDNRRRLQNNHHLRTVQRKEQQVLYYTFSNFRSKII
jgi:hypothetical protein